jgi:hypothetical protein
METVYKYPLLVADTQAVDLPLGAQILSVQAQRGDFCLWALVDPKARKVSRHIAIHGTGHPVARGQLRHINTFQMDGGALVFHAFEIMQH